MSIISNDTGIGFTETPSGFNVEELKKLLEDVLQKVPKDKRSYLHIKTVENFIFYFDNLLIKQKEKVYLALQAYLNLLKNEGDFSDYGRIDAMDCFDKFLLPISTTYQDYLGFSLYPKVWITFVWLSSLLLLLILIKAASYLYIFVFLFFIGYYIKIFTQIKKKKVYGYFY